VLVSAFRKVQATSEVPQKGHICLKWDTEAAIGEQGAVPIRRRRVYFCAIPDDFSGECHQEGGCTWRLSPSCSGRSRALGRARLGLIAGRMHGLERQCDRLLEFDYHAPTCLKAGVLEKGLDRIPESQCKSKALH
jgi:hypothetical protein